MTELEKLEQSNPNLMRVARELASYEDPDRILHALGEMLAAHKGTSNPSPKTGKSNTEKLCDVLNRCRHPRAVYNALSAFAEQRKKVET